MEKSLDVVVGLIKLSGLPLSAKPLRKIVIELDGYRLHGGNMRRIVIAGGSGCVVAGLFLARHFHEQGDRVTVLSRLLRRDPWATVGWSAGRDLTAVDRSDLIDGADVVINLAGRSVDCRYTPGNRQEIVDSRACFRRA